VDRNCCVIKSFEVLERSKLNQQQTGNEFTNQVGPVPESELYVTHSDFESLIGSAILPENRVTSSFFGTQD
jgi:hypothetical protein